MYLFHIGLLYSTKKSGHTSDKIRQHSIGYMGEVSVFFCVNWNHKIDSTLSKMYKFKFVVSFSVKRKKEKNENAKAINILLASGTNYHSLMNSSPHPTQVLRSVHLLMFLGGSDWGTWVTQLAKPLPLAQFMIPGSCN